jgi:hypothetical protein
MSLLRAVLLIGGWMLAGAVVLMLLVVMSLPRRVDDPQPVATVETIPTPIPDPVANLSVEELATMSGFDASTEQTRREQVRNNDLQWRVEKLEREVRNLNQRVYGITELRIGDEPPTKPEGTE